MSEDAVMIASSCALTNVVPSQATPSTQMDALIPDLNVDAPRMSEVLTLQQTTMTVAIDSMIEMIAASRPMTGSSMRPTLSEMIVAYVMTATRPMQKMSTESFAPGVSSRSLRPVGAATEPSARRFWYSGRVSSFVVPRTLSIAIMIAAVAMQARNVEGIATASR